MKESVERLLNESDCLALVLCNCFQSLLKLGLVPNGSITGQNDQSPTLTFNTINRHISKMVYTKVVSNKSPWLAKAELGGVYTNPASHGEGRFVAPKEWLDKLFENGQVATQYCDLQEMFLWTKNGMSTVLIWRLKVLQALTEDVLVKWHIPKDAVIPLQSISTANRI